MAKKAKLALYKSLLEIPHTELTGTEINLLANLTNDDEIQAHLEKNKKDVSIINEKIKELENAAEKKKQSIYNICFRRAGVGILFYDEEQMKDVSDWHNALYIDSYYTDLETAINAEITRLKGEKI